MSADFSVENSTGVSVGVSVGVPVGVGVGVAVGAFVDVSVGDRGFAVGAAVGIAVETAIVSAMGLRGVSLLAAAFRGSPWNVRGSPWKVYGSPWSVRGYPWNAVDIVVECRGGPWTLPRCSAKKTNNVRPPLVPVKLLYHSLILSLRRPFYTHIYISYSKYFGLLGASRPEPGGAHRRRGGDPGRINCKNKSCCC